MYTREEINLIILSSFDNLTYENKRILLGGFTSAEPDFGNSSLMIKSVPDGSYNRVKDKFYDPEYRKKVLDGLDKSGIKCVTYFSEDYPELLKNIDTPPVLLYCKGDTSLLKTKCLSIVGSRKTTPDALALCGKISGEASFEFTIVSGIAEGADCKAVEGALNAGGKVICVLAHGLDRIYPATSAPLLKKVQKDGLIISEYSPEVSPKRYYFPVRNRIIAGLSMGTLIVSAGEKSGALITADYAAEYGREVFAFPYFPTTISGKGCLNLIKNGAQVTENILDIFVSFGLDFNTPRRAELSDCEREVYEAVKADGQAFLPAVAEKLGKPFFEVSSIISSLEIKGFVSRLGGNRFMAL